MACQQRLFLLIWRKGIRQYGACVHTCPPGYFGVRGQEVNRCTSTCRDTLSPASSGRDSALPTDPTGHPGYRGTQCTEHPKRGIILL